VIDLATSKRIKLDAGKDYVICHAEWWAARPDVILAMLQPASKVGGIICTGMPAAWTVAGDPPRLLGTAPTAFYRFASSPDGKAIAFEQEGNPWIHQWGTGTRSFDMGSYGFPGLTRTLVSDPAWSPRSLSERNQKASVFCLSRFRKGPFYWGSFPSPTGC
jgi:hypothetical protein